MNKKEPLFHIVKRTNISWKKSLLIKGMGNPNYCSINFFSSMCIGHRCTDKVKSFRSISFDRGWSSRNGKTFVGDDP